VSAVQLQGLLRQGFELPSVALQRLEPLGLVLEGPCIHPAHLAGDAHLAVLHLDGIVASEHLAQAIERHPPVSV
jgi:hypothetical protein